MKSLGAFVLASLLMSAPAWAQSASEQLQKGPMVSDTSKRPPAKAALPPGLPGAALNKDRVTPSDHIAGDLPPTEALFDAINRGDIVSARDALGRGADFNARNVLGLTPLDESIDLSRNDITFLLLSLRGGSSTPELNPATVAVAGKPAPAAAKKSQAAPPRPIVQRAPPRPVAQIQPHPGNGGTPNPQNGFLGFGG